EREGPLIRFIERCFEADVPDLVKDADHIRPDLQEIENAESEIRTVYELARAQRERRRLHVRVGKERVRNAVAARAAALFLGERRGTFDVFCWDLPRLRAGCREKQSECDQALLHKEKHGRGDARFPARALSSRA